MKDKFISTQEHGTPNPDHHRLYTVSIFNHRVTTTVTRRARVVRDWLLNIRRQYRHLINRSLLVGLGVQWTAPWGNRAATIQLCVGTQCLIFQISHANSIPFALRDFLRDTGATFVGVRNYYDAQILDRDYKIKLSRVVELGKYVGCKGASIGRLADMYLGFQGVEKPEWVAMSEWERRELEIYQVQYACVDAYLALLIGKKVRAWVR